MPDVSSTSESADQFPAASVTEANSAGDRAARTLSRLWWVTGVCLVLAVAMVWMQVYSAGLLIEVQFAEGHGLEPGDAVRYRGIVVGEVRRVALQDDLGAVVVTVELDDQSRALAREGTKFWIERPDVRIGHVRGLDTLLSGHYVGVAPGPPEAQPATEFNGLDDAPEAIESLVGGLEIVLESKDRLGIQAGSPLNYRGIQIGVVQGVGLANDSTTVLARALIQPKYRALVTKESRFWSISGIDLRFGLQGLELDADTLTTITAGGVAMATPSPPGQAAATGQRFELFESPRADWLTWQPPIGIGGASLSPNVVTPAPVLSVRRTPRGPYGVFGRAQQRALLLPLADGRMVGPAALFDDQSDPKAVLEVAGQEFAVGEAKVQAVGRLAAATLPEPLDPEPARWPLDRIRTAVEPEELVLTCGSDDRTIPLAIERIASASDGWAVDRSVPIDGSWEGACAVAARDGMLVGLLVEADGQMLINPIPSELLDAEIEPSE